jgi:hypothetical protein
MGINKIFESWVNDLIGSALGIALIKIGVDSKEAPTLWIPAVLIITGILFQIPTFYFILWKEIKKCF